MDIVNQIVKTAEKNGWLREDFFKFVSFDKFIESHKNTITILVVGLKAYEEPMRINDKVQLEKLDVFLIKSLKKEIPELVPYKIIINNKTQY